MPSGAREGTRTPKDKPHAPQTCASASSATLAYLLYSSPVFEVENRWCGLLAYSNTFPAIRQVVSLFLISFFKFHIYNSGAERAQRQLFGQLHRSFVRRKPACGAAPRAKEEFVYETFCAAHRRAHRTMGRAAGGNAGSVCGRVAGTGTRTGDRKSVV